GTPAWATASALILIPPPRFGDRLVVVHSTTSRLSSAGRAATASPVAARGRTQCRVCGTGASGTAAGLAPGASVACRAPPVIARPPVGMYIARRSEERRVGKDWRARRAPAQNEQQHVDIDTPR